MIYKTMSLCYGALSKAGYFPLSSASLVLCKTPLPHRRSRRLPALPVFSEHAEMPGRRKRLLSPPKLFLFLTLVCLSRVFVCLMRCVPQVLSCQCSIQPKQGKDSIQEPPAQPIGWVRAAPLTLAAPPATSISSALSTLSKLERFDSPLLAVCKKS